MDSAVAELPPLSELYRLHRNKALAIARRILRDEEAAQDVVQDVFARLWSTAARFDGKAAYTTWLHRVMVNSCINALRTQRRREQLYESREEPLTPDTVLFGRQLQKLFNQALLEVSEQHQQVLWLREVRGLSYPEISHLLRIPEGTVKSALNRGRIRLTQLLQARSGWTEDS